MRKRTIGSQRAGEHSPARQHNGTGVGLAVTTKVMNRPKEAVIRRVIQARELLKTSGMAMYLHDGLTTLRSGFNEVESQICWPGQVDGGALTSRQWDRPDFNRR
ncbi:MAG: hypothetical protein OXJ37_18260 [Bryobacterales bacterium]|nr:hypothetical protein [Bryobacterales bacterium]